MLLTKEVEVRPTGKSIQHYRDLGYDAEHLKPIIVKVEDLTNGSHAEVDALCDYCKEKILTMKYKTYLRGIQKFGKVCCKKCKGQKIIESNLITYGVNSVSQIEEIKQKKKDTIFAHYGTSHQMHVEEVVNKIKNTCIERYGNYSPLFNETVREKITKSYYNNSSKKMSLQQIYLCNLYNGNPNYPISRFNADICLLENKIDIEYDGGGHSLRAKIGDITQEEFKQKELIRDKVIKNKGYKVVRIISSKDFLPSDQILLQMLEQAKEYFSNYPNHSWIEFDIDSSIMRNAENKDGVYYNYGELRRIKKSDVENINEYVESA